MAQAGPGEVNAATHFLVGDIGGTNLRLELKDAQNTTVKKLLVKTADFADFSACLVDFFKDIPIKPGNVRGAISIASKILDNKAVTNANYNWPLADGNQLREEFGFIDLVLLNDFEAHGYAVPGLNPEQLVALKGKTPDINKDCRIMVVGPGTGLGVCLFYKKRGRTQVLSSEGGHIGLSAFNELQFEFEQFAKSKFGVTEGLISAEWLFCGLGIPIIYEFFAKKHGKEVTQPLQGSEVFAAIDTDPIAKAAFDHFLRIFGTCLAHLSASFLPDDGIFLCGNIVSSIIERIKKDTSNPKDSLLLTAFVSNKCIGPYLENVSIVFTPEEDLGLKGCWEFLNLKKK